MGYLILSRKQGEKILLNNDIELIFLGYKGGQAKIGIRAPDYVQIVRSELYEKPD